MLMMLLVNLSTGLLIAGGKKSDKKESKKKDKDKKSDKKDKDSKSSNDGGFLGMLLGIARDINWTPCINKAKETLEAAMEDEQPLTHPNSIAEQLDSAVYLQENEVLDTDYA
jgi:hypothetical protein